MIVVTAVQNGSGRMRSVSSGATIVSPGLMSTPPPLNHALPERVDDAAVCPHDVDAIVVRALRQRRRSSRCSRREPGRRDTDATSRSAPRR